MSELAIIRALKAWRRAISSVLPGREQNRAAVDFWHIWDSRAGGPSRATCRHSA